VEREYQVTTRFADPDNVVDSISKLHAAAFLCLLRSSTSMPEEISSAVIDSPAQDDPKVRLADVSDGE